MAAPPSSSGHLVGNRVANAKLKTQKAQDNIQLAEAQLHLANVVITDKLGNTAADAELAKAVSHTEQVEEKLREAGEELKVVTDLLGSEERDRMKLEQALDALRNDGPAAAGSRTGSGSASVIEHLRELTRHKVNTEAGKS